eukprot:TRINITY_DN12251_c0_g2_i2.p1 TRINITY_DN12251_c0_g2~~TRINITY_DN12251_c0_g2_i2.p1  ORF type:complete len:791 (+),score=165.25 TRINITY_DN12251_c0_g2_i2:48-2420(+)
MQSFNRIPERWLLCPRKGETITVNEDGGGFVPMKTMLDNKYDEQIPLENRWTPEMMAGRYEEMTLLIDLTKTSRYYDRHLLPDTMHVQKIECQGHGGGPAPDQVKLFIAICKRHWDKDPKALIGVHCTHGFNRTGFMIAAYLYQERGDAIEDAISFFKRARDPGIYKDDYIRDLCKRYEGNTDGLIPVPTPAWSVEGAEQLVRVKAVIDSLTGLKAADLLPSALAEINTKVEAALRVAADSTLRELLVAHGYTDGGFTTLSDPDALRQALSADFSAQAANASQAAKAIAQDPAKDDAKRPDCETEKAEPVDSRLAYLNWRPLGPPHLGPFRKMCREMVGAPKGTTFPGAQPVSLSRENIGDLRQHDFHVSWKADGVRYLMLILKKNKATFLIGRDNNVFHIPNLFFRVNKHLEHRLDKTLLDGELCEDVMFDRRSGKTVKRLRFYIFDMICCLGKDFRKYPYHQRLESIQREIIGPREAIRRDPKRYRYTEEHISIKLKPFIPFRELGTQRWWDLLKAFHNGMPPTPKTANDPLKQLVHGTDGLILVQSNHLYEHGTCTAALKYKPPELNSIDFRFHVKDKDTSAMATLYVLGPGNQEMEFTGLAASTITARGPGKAKLLDLHNKIVECTWDRAKKSWKFYCVRKDKSHPNSINTAQRVAQSIADNIQQSELLRIAQQLRDKRESARMGNLSPSSDRKMDAVVSLRRLAQELDPRDKNGQPNGKRASKVLTPDQVPQELLQKLNGLIQVDSDLEQELVKYGWGKGNFETDVTAKELRLLADAIEGTIRSR